MNHHGANPHPVTLQPPPIRITLDRREHKVESTDQVINTLEKSLNELEVTVNKILKKAGVI